MTSTFHDPTAAARQIERSWVRELPLGETIVPLPKMSRPDRVATRAPRRGSKFVPVIMTASVPALPPLFGVIDVTGRGRCCRDQEHVPGGVRQSSGVRDPHVPESSRTPGQGRTRRRRWSRSGFTDVTLPTMSLCPARCSTAVRPGLNPLPPTVNRAVPLLPAELGES